MPSNIERRRKYALALYDAMVSDSVPDDLMLWEHGYDDAADAAIRLADDELRGAVKALEQAVRIADEALDRFGER